MKKVKSKVKKQMSLASFKKRTDTVIRKKLEAPEDAFGFVSDTSYRNALKNGKTPTEYGNAVADRLIKNGWTY